MRCRWPPRLGCRRCVQLNLGDLCPSIGALSGDSYALTWQGGTADGNLDIFTAVYQIVPDTNQPPIITSDGGGAAAAITLAENIATVTTVTASDGDGNTPTYSLVGGADRALFAIDETSGSLSFIAAPDFENRTDADHNNIYEVTVQADDGHGGTVSQAISVTVTNVVGVTITGNNSANSVNPRRRLPDSRCQPTRRTPFWATAGATTSAVSGAMTPLSAAAVTIRCTAMPVTTPSSTPLAMVRTSWTVEAATIH